MLEQTVFAITTDGLENSSVEYTYEKVKEMIETKQAEGWEFIFMAANIDVAKEGEKLGISSDRAFAYSADSEGIINCYGTMCDFIYDVRLEEFEGDEWDPADDIDED